MGGCKIFLSHPNWLYLNPHQYQVFPLRPEDAGSQSSLFFTHGLLYDLQKGHFGDLFLTVACCMQNMYNASGWVWFHHYNSRAPRTASGRP